MAVVDFAIRTRVGLARHQIQRCPASATGNDPGLVMRRGKSEVSSIASFAPLGWLRRGDNRQRQSVLPDAEEQKIRPRTESIAEIPVEFILP